MPAACRWRASTERFRPHSARRPSAQGRRGAKTAGSAKAAGRAKGCRSASHRLRRPHRPPRRAGYAPRPAIVGKPEDNKAGQVTFDDGKPAPAPAATNTDKPKQAKVEKPRRKRGGGYWNEARIMREVYRYSGYAGMIGGW